MRRWNLCVLDRGCIARCLRGTEARQMTMPITDCWQKTSIRRTRHFVALILSRVECVTVPSIPLLTSMLRARPRGLRPQYSCGAGLLRVAQLPQVRCLVRVHPRDRRTEPRHKGAARFHVPRTCSSTITRTADFHWPRAPAPQHVPKEIYENSASSRSG